MREGNGEVRRKPLFRIVLISISISIDLRLDDQEKNPI
jgi:hypothetical protein